eukprot:TRINITY_DN7642_c0_g1_i2.p1 TRINITY_DN7642_c0_g1~~TRINITY_DN7642_c0_g1_i2.p1  ORF type:complete len:561 (-),score=99.45 TRINITY_DN7642_c0_g1_i2:316-1998(-)
MQLAPLPTCSLRTGCAEQHGGGSLPSLSFGYTRVLLDSTPSSLASAVCVIGVAVMVRAIGGHGRHQRAQSACIKPRTYSRVSLRSSSVAQQQTATASSAFDWERAWYPLSPVSYLDTKKPTPFTILGRRIVVWSSTAPDNHVHWHAALDMCPHRMAPLSLGDVQEDGSLRCAYHGWCFNGEGKCTKIPMARNQEEETKMCSLARSAVATFPVQEKQGLLWVFPFPGKEAADEAAKCEPYTVPECDGTEWVMTVAPVGYEVSVENTFDPSHAPFLHRGIMKFDPKRAIPMEKFLCKDDHISGVDGFVLEHDGYDEGTKGMEATRKFSPPCSNTTVYRYPDGRVQTNQLYFVPCSQHETRYIVNLSLTGEKKGKKKSGRGSSLISDAMHALFLNRIFGYRFQEQDLLAMRGQEQVLTESPGRQWGDQYVLGTPSDKGVEVFRRWLYEHAGGGPAWAFGSSQARPRDDSSMYSRWERHAKHCPKCRRVLKALGNLESGALRLSAASLTLGAAAAILGRPASATLGVCAALASAGVKQWAASERWGFITSVPQKGVADVNMYKN